MNPGDERQTRSLVHSPDHGVRPRPLRQIGMGEAEGAAAYGAGLREFDGIEGVCVVAWEFWLLAHRFLSCAPAPSPNGHTIQCGNLDR